MAPLPGAMLGADVARFMTKNMPTKTDTSLKIDDRDIFLSLELVSCLLQFFWSALRCCRTLDGLFYSCGMT